MHNIHVPVNRASFIIVARYLLLLFVYFVCYSIFFCSLFDFVSFGSFVSLFNVQKIRFVSDPRLFSRYFDPVVQEYHHHLCKSINIIYQTAPPLS